MDLLSRIRAFIRQRDLIRPGARVVAAVSGGSDSVALVHVLRELERVGDLRLAGVVHFNHQLREAADRDERHVADLARAFDLPFTAGREDIHARAARERRSIEDAARRGRYECFERARVELGAELVALGHTIDDQAETFLLRLLRGAGPRGLASMHPRSGPIVRPLLEVRRHELREWLASRSAAGEQACSFVEDETNDDAAIARNRVRAELLPLLAARFNPGIVEVLAGEAVVMQEQWAWMEEASEPFLATPGELDVAALTTLPRALQRIVLWRAMTKAAGGRTISLGHVDAAVRLMSAEKGEGSRLEAPGQVVQRTGGKIVLKSRTENSNRPHREHVANPANQFEYSLSIPGEVHVPEASCTVSAQQAGDCAELGNGTAACVRGDLVRGSLVVRNRRPGDRFRPLSLGGSKKLQDLFVDRKLPRNERDAVPLVVDESGRIVWVAGYGIDEAFRVTDSSQAVLVLRLTRD